MRGDFDLTTFFGCYSDDSSSSSYSDEETFLATFLTGFKAGEDFLAIALALGVGFSSEDSSSSDEEILGFLLVTTAF